MNVARVSVVAFVSMCCVSVFGQTKGTTATQFPKGLSKQIIEKYKPIPLTTNVISGELQTENSGKYHYYTFIAGPGEVTLTLSVESYQGSSSNTAYFTLFDNNEQWLGGGSTMSIPNMPHQVVTKIYISSKQPVLLRITEGAFGRGKFKLAVSGAVELSRGRPTTESENLDPLLSATRESISPRSTTDDHDPLLTTSNEPISPRNRPDNLGRCLPKQGTLIIKMKDGSKKIIDLSEAETITIVP
jgi:hypothetical protein